MKRYDNYKDSGVEWIGEVPRHWEVRKVKYSFSFRTGFTPPSGKVEYYENGTNTWITIGDLQGKTVSDSANKITDKAIEDINPSIVPSGSLLYSFKLSVGRVAFNTLDCYTNEAIFSIDPDNSTNLNFFYYSLPEQIIQNANENIYGAKILNQELIKNAVLVIPPPAEQTAIATYLDRKTAEIDALIADKKRLLELYEEEKTALINQAVTKGIDPDVKMKDSGVEWLGEVPEHWKTTRINRIIKVKDGTHETPDYLSNSEGNFPLVTSKDFKNGEIDFENSKYISSDDHEKVIKRSNTENGDIIMSMIGGNIGNMVLVNTVRPFSIKNVCLFKTSHDQVAAKHLYFILKSDLLKIQITLNSRGGAQGFLSLDDLRGLVYFVLPYDEMKDIVRHIEAESALIAAKQAKTEKLIALLREYRTALVSEVVTGKVKIV